MSEKRYVKKWLPYALWDFAGIQAWLNEQAAQGYLMEYWPDWRLFARIYFRKDPDATHVRYCLDPLTEYIEDSELKARNDAYAEAGWEYVDKIERLYAIYRCDDPTAPPLYNDPQSFGWAMKRQLKLAWTRLGLELFCVIVLFWNAWESLFSLSDAALEFLGIEKAFVLCLFGCLLFMAGTMVCYALSTFFGVRRVGRYLQRDEWPPIGRRNYAEAVNLAATGFGLVLLVAAIVIYANFIQ